MLFNKISGNAEKVKIDGKPATEKLNLVKTWGEDSRLQFLKQACPLPNNIIIMDDDLFAYPLEDGDYEALGIIKYDYEKKIIKNCFVPKMVSDYYRDSGVSSGYKNGRIFISDEYGVVETFFNNDFTNPEFKGTMIYKGSNVLSSFVDRKEDVKNVYFIKDSSGVNVINKETGETTFIGHISTGSFYVQQRFHYFAYNKKIYTCTTSSNTPYYTTLFCYDIETNQSTELFKVHEKFNITNTDDTYYEQPQSFWFYILEDGTIFFVNYGYEYEMINNKKTVVRNYLSLHFWNIETDKIWSEKFYIEKNLFPKFVILSKKNFGLYTTDESQGYRFQSHIHVFKSSYIETN